MYTQVRCHRRPSCECIKMSLALVIIGRKLMKLARRESHCLSSVHYQTRNVVRTLLLAVVRQIEIVDNEDLRNAYTALALALHPIIQLSSQMFPSHVERGQILSLTTLGWRRSRRDRPPRATNKNGLHRTSQRLIRKIMLSKLFSSVCGSNEGLRRSTLTMPDSISQSRCSKVSEK